MYPSLVPRTLDALKFLPLAGTTLGAPSRIVWLDSGVQRPSINAGTKQALGKGEGSLEDCDISSLTETVISKVPFLFPTGSGISSGHCFEKEFNSTRWGRWRRAGSPRTASSDSHKLSRDSGSNRKEGGLCLPSTAIDQRGLLYTFHLHPASPCASR